MVTKKQKTVLKRGGEGGRCLDSALSTVAPPPLKQILRKLTPLRIFYFVFYFIFVIINTEKSTDKSLKILVQQLDFLLYIFHH